MIEYFFATILLISILTLAVLIFNMASKLVENQKIINENIMYMSKKIKSKIEDVNRKIEENE